MTVSLDSGPSDAPVRIVVAHGAGAGIESPFFETISVLLAERGIAVTRFEFQYMSARRTGQSKRPPPRAEALTHEYLAFVLATLKDKPKRQRLFIGGKSLGGRVASLVADELYAANHISGLVCLGYPLHPPKKPEQLRTEHLYELKCPALIVQGERDPFGNRSEVEALKLSKQIRWVWIGDGDHDFVLGGARAIHDPATWQLRPTLLANLYGIRQRRVDALTYPTYGAAAFGARRCYRLMSPITQKKLLSS